MLLLLALSLHASPAQAPMRTQEPPPEGEAEPPAFTIEFEMEPSPAMLAELTARAGGATREDEAGKAGRRNRAREYRDRLQRSLRRQRSSVLAKALHGFGLHVDSMHVTVVPNVAVDWITSGYVLDGRNVFVALPIGRDATRTTSRLIASCLRAADERLQHERRFSRNDVFARLRRAAIASNRKSAIPARDVVTGLILVEADRLAARLIQGRDCFS